MDSRSIGKLSSLGAFLLALLPDLGVAELVINEVLYNPDGPDAGKEFVEIANTGPFGVTLVGLTLEAGNGARPDDWDLQWSGPTESAIPPGGLYRIGLNGPGIGESAHLKLQNGPDGVRLCKQGFELDRLGWGQLAHSEYFEMHPAPTVRSGRSLARRRDGIDTGDNLADFEEAVPTPGRSNHPRIDWAIRLGRPTPEVPRPGESVVVRLIATNYGREEGTPPTVEVDADGQTYQVGWSRPSAAGGCAEKHVQLTAPSDTGRVTWRARLLGNDEVPENDFDSVLVRVGVGDVRIVEVMSAPGEDGCEWIELRADIVIGTILNDLAVTVRGRRLLLAPRAVDPTTRIGLVVEDSVVMLQRHPRIDPSILWGCATEGRMERCPTQSGFTTRMDASQRSPCREPLRHPVFPWNASMPICRRDRRRGSRAPIRPVRRRDRMRPSGMFVSATSG